MIAPYAHLGELDAAPREATTELMDLVKRCQTALREVYRPQGFNVPASTGASPTTEELVDYEGRGVVYEKASDVPINPSGEVEDEAFNREASNS